MSICVPNDWRKCILSTSLFSEQFSNTNSTSMYKCTCKTRDTTCEVAIAGIFPFILCNMVEVILHTAENRLIPKGNCHYTEPFCSLNLLNGQMCKLQTSSAQHLPGSLTSLSPIALSLPVKTIKRDASTKRVEVQFVKHCTLNIF
jgi:hypothetical protein